MESRASSKTRSRTAIMLQHDKDIMSWIQSFEIYDSVVASKYLEQAPNMLTYQKTLVREASWYGGGGLLAYDTAFCQLAARKPTSGYGPELQLVQAKQLPSPVTFMAQAITQGTLHFVPAATTGVTAASIRSRSACSGTRSVLQTGKMEKVVLVSIGDNSRIVAFQPLQLQQLISKL